MKPIHGDCIDKMRDIPDNSIDMSHDFTAI